MRGVQFSSAKNLEEQIADQLGIARKAYHGKSFEGRKCSKLLSCSAFLKELVPTSDHPLFECLEALYRVLVGILSETLDVEFENDIYTFKGKFMRAMLKHNLRMTSKVHVLVLHVPEYVCRAAAPLGPTSENALGSQHRFFDIFYHIFKVNSSTCGFGLSFDRCFASTATF